MMISTKVLGYESNWLEFQSENIFFVNNIFILKEVNKKDNNYRCIYIIILQISKIFITTNKIIYETNKYFVGNI